MLATRKGKQVRCYDDVVQGNEAFDRWSMMPALLTPRQLFNPITRL